MKRAIYVTRYLLMVSAFVALAISVSAQAGSIAGFGGSTEITQLMNNIELAGSNVKQAALVAKQIEANITKLKHLAAAMQNLKSLPDALRNGTVSSYMSQINDLKRAYGTVTDLQKAVGAASAMMTSRVAEMKSLKLDPASYVAMESELAATKGGIYQQQMQDDLAAIDTLQQRSAQLQVLANSPVTGNLEGIQLLNHQTSMLTGEMMDLKAAVLHQNMIANSERRDQQLEKSVANEAARKNHDATDQRDGRNKSFGGNAEFNPSWSK